MFADDAPTPPALFQIATDFMEDYWIVK